MKENVFSTHSRQRSFQYRFQGSGLLILRKCRWHTKTTRHPIDVTTVTFSKNWPRYYIKSVFKAGSIKQQSNSYSNKFVSYEIQYHSSTWKPMGPPNDWCWRNHLCWSAGRSPENFLSSLLFLLGRLQWLTGDSMQSIYGLSRVRIWCLVIKSHSFGFDQFRNICTGVFWTPDRLLVLHEWSVFSEYPGQKAVPQWNRQPELLSTSLHRTKDEWNNRTCGISEKCCGLNLVND